MFICRDIKPGNVMLDDTGQGVLMDLGSAAKARVEIKTRSEAQSLQVGMLGICVWGGEMGMGWEGRSGQQCKSSCNAGGHSQRILDIALIVNTCDPHKTGGRGRLGRSGLTFPSLEFREK